MRQCMMSDTGDCGPVVWFSPSTGEAACSKHKAVLEEVLRLQGDATDWMRLPTPETSAAAGKVPSTAPGKASRNRKKVDPPSVGMCYFCGCREAHPLEAYRMQQTRLVKEEAVRNKWYGPAVGYKRQYQDTTHEYPRCCMCASVHRQLNCELIYFLLCDLAWLLFGGILLFTMFGKTAYGQQALAAHVIITAVVVPILWLGRRLWLLRSAGTQGTFWATYSQRA